MGTFGLVYDPDHKLDPPPYEDKEAPPPTYEESKAAVSINPKRLQAKIREVREAMIMTYMPSTGYARPMVSDPDLKPRKMYIPVEASCNLYIGITKSGKTNSLRSDIKTLSQFVEFKIVIAFSSTAMTSGDLDFMPAKNIHKPNEMVEDLRIDENDEIEAPATAENTTSIPSGTKKTKKIKKKMITLFDAHILSLQAMADDYASRGWGAPPASLIILDDCSGLMGSERTANPLFRNLVTTYRHLNCYVCLLFHKWSAVINLARENSGRVQLFMTPGLKNIRATYEEWGLFLPSELESYKDYLRWIKENIRDHRCLLVINDGVEPQYWLYKAHKVDKGTFKIYSHVHRGT
jgi:hypothetical protein